MKQMRAILFLSVVFLFREVSYAWSSPGHMIIAAIAYRNLTMNEKTNVNEILRHHPEYDHWKDRYSTNEGIDLETYVFMEASTWPDQIRRRGSPYDHPQWHYVDYPLEPPNFPDKGSPFTTNDVLYGVGQCENVLKNKSESPEVRAAYLSWLIHLVGDMHQPLHCATLVTTNYPAPTGDKGGNAFFVRPGAKGVNLHSIWDQGLGSSVNPRVQYNAAIEISASHSRTNLEELSKDKTPESWSKESRAIAIEDGYLYGLLQGSRESADAPALPSDYTKNLKIIAEKQAALAGFRLADEIHQFCH